MLFQLFYNQVHLSGFKSVEWQENKKKNIVNEDKNPPCGCVCMLFSFIHLNPEEDCHNVGKNKIETIFDSNFLFWNIVLLTWAAISSESTYIY